MIFICNIVRFICYCLFSILASLYIRADVNYLFIRLGMWYTGASQVALVVKNPPASGGDIRDTGSIPELGRSPGGGHGNPLQYSCLENALDRGAWQATVHRVTHSRVRLKWWGTAQRILLFFLHKWNNRGRIKFYSFYFPNIPAPFYIVNSQAPWT